MPRRPSNNPKIITLGVGLYPVHADHARMTSYQKGMSTSAYIRKLIEDDMRRKDQNEQQNSQAIPAARSR